MCCLLRFTMSSLSQTEQRYRDYNKRSEEQTKDAKSVETTTNQTREESTKNVKITTKVIPDKTNQGL